MTPADVTGAEPQAAEIFPSENATTAHAWTVFSCVGCGLAVGGVGSFDSTRAPKKMLCRDCYAWHTLRCARCNHLLGSCPGEAHDSPLVYCSPCVAGDVAAKEAREAAAQEPGAAPIGDPGASSRADSEEDAA
jgi:hypothetical protein